MSKSIKDPCFKYEMRNECFASTNAVYPNKLIMIYWVAPICWPKVKVYFVYLKFPQKLLDLTLTCIDNTYTPGVPVMESTSKPKNSINSKAAISCDLVAVAGLINSAQQQQNGCSSHLLSLSFSPSCFLAVMNLNVMNERRLLSHCPVMASRGELLCNARGASP